MPDSSSHPQGKETTHPKDPPTSHTHKKYPDNCEHAKMLAMLEGFACRSGRI